MKHANLTVICQLILLILLYCRVAVELHLSRRYAANVRIWRITSTVINLQLMLCGVSTERRTSSTDEWCDVSLQRLPNAGAAADARNRSARLGVRSQLVVNPFYLVDASLIRIRRAGRTASRKSGGAGAGRSCPLAGRPSLGVQN